MKKYGLKELEARMSPEDIELSNKEVEEDLKRVVEDVDDDLPDTDDEEGAPKQKYYDKLNELEHLYSDDAYHVIEMVLEDMDDSSYDIGDLIAQELDNACIYYKDCWDYLWNQNITDFDEAIAEGATSLTSIAYHYLAEEVYELASKIGLEW